MKSRRAGAAPADRLTLALAARRRHAALVSAGARSVSARGRRAGLQVGLPNLLPLRAGGLDRCGCWPQRRRRSSSSRSGPAGVRGCEPFTSPWRCMSVLRSSRWRSPMIGRRRPERRAGRRAGGLAVLAGGLHLMARARCDRARGNGAWPRAHLARRAGARARAADRGRAYRDPHARPAAGVPRPGRGAPRQADRDLRDRPQARRARLAPAVQGRGLPLWRADDHPAQAAQPAAQGRRPRARRSASPARPSARSSSAGSWRRQSATTATTSPRKRPEARVPPPGTRLFRPSKRQTMRGRLHSPQTPALLARGHPRQRRFCHPALDVFIRMRGLGTAGPGFRLRARRLASGVTGSVRLPIGVSRMLWREGPAVPAASKANVVSARVRRC